MYNKSMKSARALAILFIFAAVLIRLLPHPPNVAPIVGVGLFCGAYFSKRWVWVLPVLTMAAGDFLLGLRGVNLFGWVAVALIGGLGLLLRSQKRLGPVAAASLAGSVIFYLISNFGVWMVGGLYPPTVSGLINCYVAGIPFFSNAVMGDLVYTAILFGGYELFIRWLLSTAHPAVESKRP
jgi:hypothetical protein